MPMNFLSNSSGMVGFSVTPGAPCGSQGGAEYDPPSHDPMRMAHGVNCWLMTAPPVIIGDTYMSMAEGFAQVNVAFHTNGNQPAVPAVSGLEGPRG